MLDRIYWIYTQLKRNRFPSLSRYTAQFEVSQSTFKRDLAFLRDRLGAPIEYSPTNKGYGLTDGSFELPSSWFNRLQLLMILGACRHLQSMSEGEMTELKQLRERVETLLTMHYGEKVLGLVSFGNVEWTRFDINLFDVLLTTMMEQRLLNMTYHTAYSGKTIDRTVEPYRLYNYMGSWNLVGYCHHRKDARIFLLSRIKTLQPLDKCFKNCRFDVDALLCGTFGIYKGGPVQRVALRFSPDLSRSIRDEVWHQEQEMSQLPDGGIQLTFWVAELTEIRRHVLKYGAEVEVLEPEDLRNQVAEEARQICDLYKK